MTPDQLGLSFDAEPPARPDDISARLRSGSEVKALAAAREAIAAGTFKQECDALIADLWFSETPDKPEVELGLRCMIAAKAGMTPQQVKEWAKDASDGFGADYVKPRRA